ncbi:MAG: translation initiation factor IF-6 [Nanobdellota archaeon]
MVNENKLGRTKVLQISGSSNVGIFAYTSDNFCLVGKSLSDEEADKISKALAVPIHFMTIGKSNQLGALINGNSKGIIVPEIITEEEKSYLDELEISYKIIDTKYTALGNNIICNDNYMFYNPEMEENAIKEIKQFLGIEGEALYLEDWEAISAILAINDKGGIIQKNVTEKIKKHIEDKLGIKLEYGTVNFGSHIVGGGVIVNSKGLVIGEESAGIEITNADMAFGFLE